MAGGTPRSGAGAPGGALAALGVAAVGGLAYAWLVESRWYALREVTVPVLAPGSGPLRVLHLSDLHLTPGDTRRADWVRDLGSLGADLVVDTGDNWSHPDALGIVERALEPHLARPGAYVLGSNDLVAPRAKNPARYLLPDSREHDADLSWLPSQHLVRLLDEAGWVGLENRRAELRAGGLRISLVGTSDAHLDHDELPPAGGADDARTAGPTDLHLGVTHAPYRRVLDGMLADGADLILAGHTHGGQLAVPGWGALVTNCDLDTRRAKGLHGWPGRRPDELGGAGSTWLHVSAGVGTSPYAPVRFACRPEATLLTLVPVA